MNNTVIFRQGEKKPVWEPTVLIIKMFNISSGSRYLVHSVVEHILFNFKKKQTKSWMHIINFINMYSMC